jgi:asparagine synthase (glutamine-hydrolysing)
MCGITGLFYFDPQRPVEQAAVEAMRAVIRHRGPDDSGLFLSGNVGFGFNRLSIIDLSGGHQPMSTGDGAATIVFNGEIYNFQEVRQELAARGRRFQTHSDTEVILQAWEEYGEHCVDHLRGMFGFAIWDSRRRILFAARDRLGIKPFYYYLDDRQFAFASEVKSLLELPQVPREVDSDALADFLHHGYTIAPNTILRHIKKLPPAHTVTVTSSGATVRRYWDVPMDGPLKMTEEDALEQFGALIEETVRMHLISDVPLGAFLSGGLDSSAVVALMARVGTKDIKTFSIGYDSAESELEYAQLVADHFHTDHYPLRMTAGDFRDILPQIVWHMDEPVFEAPAIPLYYISRFARKRVTVALSGEGADELLCGYPIYNFTMAMEKAGRLPLSRTAGALMASVLPEGRARKYANLLGRPLEECHGGISRVFTPENVKRLMPRQQKVSDPFGSIAEAYTRCRTAPPLLRMSYVDMTTWLPDDLLIKADRMSMATSLELRVPFLDHKVVEFAARLPLDLKIRGGVNKYLLKRFIGKDLPPEIVNRPKAGFPVPKKAWFRGDLAGFAREALLASDRAARHFFPAVELERLLAVHQRRDCSDQIYALLVFNEWHRAFMSASASAGTNPLPATKVVSSALP